MQLQFKYFQLILEETYGAFIHPLLSGLNSHGHINLIYFYCASVDIFSVVLNITILNK